jgi:ABC-type polysaccharide/polyol phosphate transport system ATPase subunit
MPIIEVDHVTKTFALGQLHSIKLTIERALARTKGSPAPAKPKFNALDDVHFSVEAGEVLGIIGENGAGKSTLLKLLSGISVPSAGHVTVRGKVAPLIEVGAGLIGDLTGRENIFLNATILGMRRATVRRMLDEIVSFAELEDFIDTPVKRYSSGMTIRLAFSIASSVDADILIVDEVLAVGDLAFQAKCYERMERIIRQDRRTLIVVSHDVRQVERLCTRAILLDHGRILLDAPATDTCNLYYERSDEKIKANTQEALARPHANSADVELLGTELLDEFGENIETVICDEELTIALTLKVKVPLTNATIGIGVHTPDYVRLATDYSPAQSFDARPAPHEVRCTVKRFPFRPGVYGVRVVIRDHDGEAFRVVYEMDGVILFRATTRNQKRTEAMQHGPVPMQARWSAVRLDEPPA